ncbi:MAG: glycosyltransferase, partial [Muribaculaceae bacterium]|nr:glycosyltransferase [Muribaculaceae bacterium]
MSPRISVIILTCNQCDTTLRCLAALTPLPRDIELILVDNGSTDGTAGKVNAIYPGVTI